MAEIITDILGAVRRGLYAAFSMATPKSTVSSSTSGMDTAKEQEAEIYTIKKPAIMKISPWAKLMRRRMP